MDITLLPPTSILSAHSHHVYHQPPPSPVTHGLLPSALPRGPTRGRCSSFAPVAYPRAPFGSSHPASSYRSKRRAHEPPPPSDGTCLLDTLPDEVFLHILAFLDREEVLCLRPTCRRMAGLALAPSLHQELTLLSLPPHPLPLLLRDNILAHLRHLHLHLFPYPSPTSNTYHPSTVLLALLRALPPDQLLSLSLPFSAPYLSATDLGEALRRIGGKLEKLDLRGSGVVGPRSVEWLREIGKNGRGLLELDLSFTAISRLPIDDQPPARNILAATSLLEPTMKSLPPFRNLVRLSLASCAGLSSQFLEPFLSSLPPTLEFLDLSRLEQVTLGALMGLRVVHSSDNHTRHIPTDPLVSREMDELRPTALREIKLVGIDHLTRQNIRRLKVHWEDQRKACFPHARSLPAPLPLRPRVWGEPRTPPSNLPASRVSAPLPVPQTPVEADTGTGHTTSISPASSVGSEASEASEASLHIVTPPNVARVMPWMYSPDDEMSRLLSHPYLPTRYPSVGGATRSSSDFKTLLFPSPPPFPSTDQLSGSPIPEVEHPGTLTACKASKAETAEDVGDFQSGGRKAEKEINGIAVNIIHSAILESEDEAGYRQFIGEMVDGTVGLGLGLALGDPGGGAVSRVGEGWGADIGMGLGLHSGVGLGLGMRMDGGPQGIGVVGRRGGGYVGWNAGEGVMVDGGGVM